MIVCPTCSKENEDFFKFCLGCGSELDGAPVVPSGATQPATEAPTEKVGAPEPAPAPAPEPPAPAPAPVPVAQASEPEAFDPSLDKTVETPALELGPKTPALRTDFDVSDTVNETRAAEPEEQWPPLDSIEEIDLEAPPAPETRKAPPLTAQAKAELLEPEDTIIRPPMAEISAPTPPAVVSSDDVEASPSHCRVCGAEVNQAYAFCANCGASLDDPRSTAPRPVVEPEPPRSGVVRGRLVLIREDGTDGESYPLDVDGTVIGRDAGHVNFPDDDFLAPQHAELVYDADGLRVRPTDSTNGVFVRLLDEAPISSGDCFRVGQELLRFDQVRDIMVAAEDHDGEGTLRLGSPLPRDIWGRLTQVIGPDHAGAAFLLINDDVYLGRERGDITFPEDGYVSGSHAVLSRRHGQVVLKDLGSSNGTYLRLHGERALQRGDFILAGQQLFRVEP